MFYSTDYYDEETDQNYIDANAGQFEYNDGILYMTGRFPDTDVYQEAYGPFHANGFSGPDSSSGIQIMY